MQINSLDKVEARRFVYRHILRLEKKGLLERRQSAGKERTYYSKTDRFSADLFISASGTELEKKPVETVSTGLRLQLKEKLNSYRSELLITMGETEEYKTLCKDFPDLAQELQEQYNSARDHCSKVHGRIKAIENLMKKKIILSTDHATA